MQFIVWSKCLRTSHKATSSNVLDKNTSPVNEIPSEMNDSSLTTSTSWNEQIAYSVHFEFHYNEHLVALMKTKWLAYDLL